MCLSVPLHIYQPVFESFIGGISNHEPLTVIFVKIFPHAFIVSMHRPFLCILVFMQQLHSDAASIEAVIGAAFKEGECMERIEVHVLQSAAVIKAALL